MTNEFRNKTASKRGQKSPEKISRPKEQTKISNYWLGKSSMSENTNSNRFEIFNTIEQDNENDQTKDKYPKPPPIFRDCVSHIKPFFFYLIKLLKINFTHIAQNRRDV